MTVWVADENKDYTYNGSSWIPTPAADRNLANGVAPLDGSSKVPLANIPTITGVVTSLPFVIDGGGAAITTGVKGAIEVPFTGTITASRLYADQSGDIVLTIKKATYSGLPTFSSIVASAKPTLSSAQKSQDTTLTGWTTAVTAGDWLEYTVDSAATVERVTSSLTLTRSIN
jgi:hypothetical protein